MNICKHQKENVLLLMWSLVKTLFCVRVCVFCETENYVFFSQYELFIVYKICFIFMYDALHSTFLYTATQDTQSYTNSVLFC